VEIFNFLTLHFFWDPAISGRHAGVANDRKTRSYRQKNPKAAR